MAGWGPDFYMHYKNGRPAVSGDKVLNLSNNVCGILHSTNAQSSSCNGRLALLTPNDPYITVSECLHMDDVKAATIPDTSQAPTA